MTTLPSDLPSRQRRKPLRGGAYNSGRGGTLKVCTYILGALIACDAAFQFYLTNHAGADSESMRVFDALPDLESLVAMSSSLSFSWDDSGSSEALDPQGAGEGLVFTPISSRSYEVNLNSEPIDQVAITLRDEDDCFRSFIPRALVFTPQNWNVPRLIQVQEDPSKYWSGCPSRVVHEVFSTDPDYHGVHVRTQPLAGFTPILEEIIINDDQQKEALDSKRNYHSSDGSIKKTLSSDDAEDSNNVDGQATEDDRGKVINDNVQGSNDNGEEDVNLGRRSGGTSSSASGKSKKGRIGSTQARTDLTEQDKEALVIPIKGFQPLEEYTSDINLKEIIRDYNCSRTSLPNGAIKCAFAQNTPWVSHFYIVSSSDLKSDLTSPAPLVFIASGVHGKEFAGFGAGGIIKTWQPAQGRMIVIDRMNARGIEKRTRYIPRYSKMSSLVNPGVPVSSETASKHDDLNRAFPEKVEEMPDKVLPMHIWNLVARFQPKIFLDLHEGWGYYAQLKSHEAKEPNVLVGNPKFSKGSSVIVTDNALDLAQHMVDIVNANIRERSHRFEVLSPPISGGLARRVHNAFGAQSFVLETTQQNQALEKRITQHLQMVAGVLSRLGFLDKTFKPARVRARKPTTSSASSSASSTASITFSSPQG
mmetsp:Transcript_21488/g.42213  ORF Transcript_21488/g.42213 Transcript_21488/m.42213 type:complete len:646 (-) Transcript_21488:222-2159(-)